MLVGERTVVVNIKSSGHCSSLQIYSTAIIEPSEGQLRKAST